jgi:class 3 adenylate cyclase/tetratricopeptide (TPR) repeat protein
MSDYTQLEQAIAALEAQRALLGDTMVDAAVGPLRDALSALRAQAIEHGAEERKQVTVLFADLPGFTALAARLDAEDVSETMNALWARLDAILTVHGGMIDKHIGDAVMALFGAPVAREDDPERAVRAALAMQLAIGDFGLRIGDLAAAAATKSAIPNPQSAIRIGIHTGPVVLGTVGSTAEYTALGDTVNVANRLEQAAPPGGVLISHDTYRQVQGLFDVDELEPLAVKGKSEPLHAYLVRAARTSATRTPARGVEGIVTPTIGRAAEFGRLQALLHAIRLHNRPQFVTLAGEPGIGKSRLVDELAAWVAGQPPAAFYKGRSTPQTTSLPYALLRDLFVRRFGIHDNDSAAVARESFARAATALLAYAFDDDGAAMRAHCAGQLLGFDFSASPYVNEIIGDAQRFHERASTYLLDLCAAVPPGAFVVIVFEDIHWADERSLDFVERLGREVDGVPLLIVCVARHELFERRPAWGAGATRIDLGPLSADDTRRLAISILRKVESLPVSLVNLIVESADGNPFYVEELIKMFIEDGLIVKNGVHWHIAPERLPELHVPPTLLGVLQARLDSLPVHERETLQRAAVVGRIFWDRTVAFLGGERAAPGAPPAPGALDDLCSRELIFPHDHSTFEGTREFVFKHALLRDVAYESMLKRVRRAYHAQVAAWLLSTLGSGERVNEYLGLIAEHLEHAGETVQAIEYLGRAGEQAMGISAWRESVGFFTRALALCETSGASECAGRLTRLLGEAYHRMGDFGAARAHLERSLALARGRGDHGEAAAALVQLGRVAWLVGDYAHARGVLVEALALARTQAQHGTMLHALLNLGTLAWQTGDSQVAQAYLEEALQTARAAGDVRREAAALNNLGNLALTEGEHGRARDYYLASLALHEQTGDRAGIAICYGNLAHIALELNDFEEARARFESSLVIDRQTGNRWGIARTLGNLGEVASRQGDLPRARRHLIEALRLSRTLGAAPGTLLALTQMAGLLALEGQLERATLILQAVQRHPATDSDTRAGAAGMLAEMGAAPAAEEALLPDMDALIDDALET